MSLFCLVHGSTQNSEGWARLVPELGKRGHAVLAVNLPTNEPHSSATRYADFILEAIDRSGHEVGEIVVVAHSASGIFLPLVAARRPVARMVFLAALVPELGTSILDQLRADREMLNPEWIGKDPMEEEVAQRFLFHDCASDVIDWALGTRAVMNVERALEEVCPLAVWPGVPASYVVCAEDRTISPSWSRRVARERLGAEAIELPGGHCPYVSRPRELAEVLTSGPILGAGKAPVRDPTSRR
jgi:pimeloyl-ACP methyl ester carboxylesterase